MRLTPTTSLVRLSVSTSCIARYATWYGHSRRSDCKHSSRCYAAGLLPLLFIVLNFLTHSFSNVIMEQTPLHLDKDLQSDSPNVDWPINRLSAHRRNSHTRTSSDTSAESAPSHTPTPEVLPASVYPHGRKSLSGIATRGFVLGITFGVCSTLTILSIRVTQAWRATFFLQALSLFHFLEYYMTARHNTPAANINAFLLSQNGRAYNTAHTVAFAECLLSFAIFPTWQKRLSNPYTVALGLCMMILGQAIRSAAMAHAGTNFNHTVQTKRNEGHVLVTSGIYAWFRHPSYFGFFWWGIGTQVVLGNIFCGIAYLVILWGFFRSRIRKEEELLMTFFGEEYTKYRNRTPVRIPFIP